MNVNIMKALVYEGPKTMNVAQIPIPSLNDDEVLIKVKRVGICGSELGGYLGHNSLRKPPLVMGHEFSGVVAAVGNKVKKIKEGNRVTANPLVSCDSCSECKEERPHLCVHRALLGAHIPGSFAEYVKITEKNVYLLPKHISMDIGALTEPFACGVHICRVAQLTGAERMLIIGAGPIGLFVLRAAQLLGLKEVVVMDINSKRLDIARELNAITISSLDGLNITKANSRFDIAIDAVGMELTRNQCIEAVRPGGKVVFSGLHEQYSNFRVDNMIRNEVTTYGAFAYTPKDFEIALKWISEGHINLLKWIEHLPLEKGDIGFEKLINNPGNVAKVLLTL